MEIYAAFVRRSPGTILIPISDEAYRLTNGPSPGDVAAQRGRIRPTTSHPRHDEVGSLEQAADGAVDEDHRFSRPLNIYKVIHNGYSDTSSKLCIAVTSKWYRTGQRLKIQYIYQCFLQQVCHGTGKQGASTLQPAAAVRWWLATSSPTLHRRGRAAVILPLTMPPLVCCGTFTSLGTRCVLDGATIVVSPSLLSQAGFEKWR